MALPHGALGCAGSPPPQRVCCEPDGVLIYGFCQARQVRHTYNTRPDIAVAPSKEEPERVRPDGRR